MSRGAAHPTRIVLGLVLLASTLEARAGVERAPSTVVALDVHAFRPVEGPSSGPAVYYRVVDEPGGPLLRGSYRPGMQTVTMATEIPAPLRRRAVLLRWLWRPRDLPSRGDERRVGRGDSAASVSIAFRRGLKWYVLKYVWSSDSPLGAVCDRKRSLFLDRDTIVLERGRGRGTWLREVVDVRRAFVDHFAAGNANAEIPDLVGVAVMSDGDQTQSESGAEWADFELVY